MSMGQISAAVRMSLMVVLSSGLTGVWMLPAMAQTLNPASVAAAGEQEEAQRRSPVALSEVERSATSVADWMAQVEAARVQITDVRIERADAGLQVILETENGALQVPQTRTLGNALIVEIENAAIAQEFSQAEPIEGIALVEVTGLPGDRVRVAITGTDAPPVAQISSDTQQLMLNVAVGSVAKAGDDEAIQVVVTGEQSEGFNPSSATTATRTDTPLRDIPQSIQVIPQQILEDQNVNRLEEAVRNAPGVNQASAPYFINGTFLVIRGFTARDDSGNILRNSLPDPIATRQMDFSNIERVEILRGPASVLFGRANPGGTVNLITEQPLRNPFYEVTATVGSYDFYRGAIDLSGPLNDSRTALYRLNVAYQNVGSFIDFVDSERFFVSPVLSFAIGERTTLTLEGEYSAAENRLALGVPASGSVLPNPNGQLPISRNIGEPFLRPFEADVYRAGYILNHEFSNSLSLRNAFRFSSYYATLDEIFGIGLQADNRTLNRQYTERTFLQQGYSLTTDLTARFPTGSIEHQLIFGVDLSRFDSPTFRGIGRAIAPLDIFNPVYGSPLGEPFTRFNFSLLTDTLGVYLQDQVTLADNLKLLLGGRLDFFKQVEEDFLANTESSLSGSAFSPRLGIVYQPIEPISLYASYSTSFTPVAGFASDGSEFQPERGRQFEIGVKAGLTERLSATLALYDLTRSNVLTSDPNNPDFSIQTGEQRSRGVDLTVGGEILPGWSIYAGYAYTDARVTEDNNFDGNLINNVPENSFNIWTTYEIQSGDLRGLGFGFGLFYKGETQGDLANSFTIPSYLRTDVSLFYRRNNFRASINVRNLFDLNYYEFAVSRNFVYAAEPLTVQATVSWRF